MKKSIDIFVWAILLFLITPSGMVLASWNAVPGDYTYSWKLSLEKVLLWVLSPSDTLQSTTQVKIAERRFGEVEQVIGSEYTVESLENLNQQLDTTTSNVLEISKDEARSEVTDKYIASLKEMSNSLSEQKSKAQTGAITVVQQKTTESTSKNIAKNTNTTSTTTKTVTNTPTTTPSIIVPTTQATPVPADNSGDASQEQTTTTEDTEAVVDEISKTEDKIQETIKQLEDQQRSTKEKMGQSSGTSSTQSRDQEENRTDDSKTKSQDDSKHR